LKRVFLVLTSTFSVPLFCLLLYYKGIFDYFYLFSLYAHNIKSRFSVKRIMTFQIEHRTFNQVLSFSGINSVEWVTKIWRVSFFYFNKNKAAVFFSDNVYFPKSAPEVFFNDFITCPFQGIFSPLFTFPSFFLFRRQGIPSHP